MQSAIALFGGSFDPVAKHHVAIVKKLLDLKLFKEIVIVPCGPRPDKKRTNDTDPVFRAMMLQKTFQNMSKSIRIDTDDLELDLFTRTHALEQKYQSLGAIWHVVGADWIDGGGRGRSKIQTQWARGRSLWRDSRFIVVKRVGCDLSEADLPPHHMLLQEAIDGSSSAVRNRCFNHLPIDELVPADVAAVIERYHLYRGQPPLKKTACHISSPRLKVVADRGNPKAIAYRRGLESYLDDMDPNIIVAVGGDGKLTEAIRNHWNLRLPFFGLNAGHEGYLLNDLEPDQLAAALKNLTVYHLPLLDVELLTASGKKIEVYGFNDAWMERETGQTAWIELNWNGTHVIDRIVGDGLLVSTAAGSTGYAKNLCKFSLPTHMNELLLVGMGISKPFGWQDTVFAPDSVFQMTVLDEEKRPLRAFVDGVPFGTVSEMRVRVSRVASAELAFVEDSDIMAKHTRLQLPYFSLIERKLNEASP